jgi:hypothetical protein
MEVTDMIIFYALLLLQLKRTSEIALNPTIEGEDWCMVM